MKNRYLKSALFGILLSSSLALAPISGFAEETSQASSSAVVKVLTSLDSGAISESSAQQYTIIDQKEDAWGLTHLKLEKQVEGIPVDSDYVILHLTREGKINSVTGNPDNTSVSIHSTDIIGKDGAIKTIMSDNQGKNDKLDVLSADKYVTNEGQLFYKVRVTTPPTSRPLSLDYKINATDGTIMSKQNITERVDPASHDTALTDSFNRQINVPVTEDAHGIALTGIDSTGVKHTVVDGKSEYSIIQAPRIQSLNQNAVDAYTHGKHVKDYYENTFQRHSIDNNGMAILTVVDEQDPSAYNNAFWDGKTMRYGETTTETGKTYASSLDVVGHEMTHGVTEQTARLEYTKQSGALNESYSDLMGYIIAGATNPEIGADTHSVDRKKGIRNLAHPKRHNQPETMAQYINTEEDNGGVHFNSGIINKIGYEIIQRLGVDKAQSIFYNSLYNYLTPNSQFSDARDAMISATKIQYGEADADIVGNIFSSAGIESKSNTNQVNSSKEDVVVMTGSKN